MQRHKVIHQGGFKNPFVAADVSRRIIQAKTGTFAPTDVGGYERVLESALRGYREVTGRAIYRLKRRPAFGLIDKEFER